MGRAFDMGSMVLPNWLPDETLYSLISRTHLLRGARTPAETSRALFGASCAGYQHDFPTKLTQFCHLTRGTLGTANELAIERTILPFFLLHRSASDAAVALAMMRGDEEGMLKYRLGLLTSRFGAAHPLKACPQCVIEDEARHGIAYWHLAHQYPGVWICLAHCEGLWVSDLKATGVRRFDWVLPDAASLKSAPPLGWQRSAAERFAALAIAWAENARRGAIIADEALASTYHAYLRSHFPDERGWPQAFCNAVQSLRGLPDLQALPRTVREAHAHLTRRVTYPRGGTHPLRHLAIIFWLFGDWPAFERWREEGAGVPLLPAQYAHGISRRTSDPRQGRLQELMCAGRSLTAAAAEVGVTVATAGAWACAMGQQIKRRAKILKPGVLNALVFDLRAGHDKAKVAACHAVSVQTVTRVLRSEVGLHDAWTSARFLTAQHAARRAWLDEVARAPTAGTKAWRTQALAAYAWLYRNDREWLKACIARHPSAKPQRARRIDWLTRDTALSEEVRATATQLKQGNPNLVLRRGMLCQQIPGLKAKLSCLDRLPLTRAAIQQACLPRTRRERSRI